MAPRRVSKLDRVHTRELVEVLFEDDLHPRRVLSLANGFVLRRLLLRLHWPALLCGFGVERGRPVIRRSA